ncbi:MAG: hypothetical protein H6712_17655 [Myxococcales bacterium]|nr:hypothetical protein [Myxococcales bacterium]MCB9715700.1 hypothetical protein [Myxococcales bacterium]
MTWLLPGLLLAGLSGGPAELSPAIHETGAERLHRQGVHCMDVIERSECAIEHFEALIDEDTRQRELVTDALLRLMTLYRREGRPEDIGPLLRKFWDAGGGRRASGHLPYSARFLPPELDMMINLDPPRVLGSAMIERSEDLGEYFFTCDEVRRHDIEIEHRWRRAAAKAASEGRETWELFYEQLDEQAERERKREERRAERSEQERERDQPPLVLEIACPLAEALDIADNRGWRRMTGASHHRERDKVAAIFQVDQLETRLAAAVEAGRLLRDGSGRYRLPDFEYGEHQIRLVSLDKDELVAAPVALLGPMEEAKRKRKRRMNRELDRLVTQVPKDTAMFVVLNQAALRELGFGDMDRRSLRSVLETILPRPKGLQVAAVFGSSMAMLTRVPTDSAVRGRMLVGLANTMLARGAEDDPEAAKWLSDLDVAEASDRKALLASYVVTLARLEEILWD